MNAPRQRLGNWILISLLSAAPLAAKARPPASPTYPPQRLQIRAEAKANLNVDPAGNPLSVVVRVYQLKDALAFAKLTYDLATSGRPDTELLGPACLGQRELTLVPGSSYQGSEDFLPGTHYLGVIAFFRSPDPHYWRCLAKVAPPSGPPVSPPPPPWYKRAFVKKPKPLPPPEDPVLSFTVQACYLRLDSPVAETIPGQPATFSPRCDSADLDEEAAALPTVPPQAAP